MSDFKCVACRKNDVVRRILFIESQRAIPTMDGKMLVTAYATVCNDPSCEEVVRANPAMPWGGIPSRMRLLPHPTEPLPGVAPF